MSESPEPEPDSDGCSSSQHALVAHLRSRRSVQPARISRLPGWTVGHVLTHIARNADSYRSLLDGRPQYEGGWDQRNADISAGAGRAWPTLVDDVVSSCAELERSFARVEDWDRKVPMLFGAQPARLLPHARRREIEVHRVDLDLGYKFDDVPRDFVVADCSLLGRWWIAANQPRNGLPEAVSSLAPRERWLWLLGRTDVDGAGPASLF